MEVSDPNDRYEREADRIAEHVLRTTEPTASPHGIGRTGSTGHLQQRPETNGVSRGASPRQPSGNTRWTTGHPVVHDALQRGGRPLPADVRAAFEPRIGHDLSDVRLHTDTDSALVADALHARAFTIGTHVYVGSRDTLADRDLLAHELAHAVQDRDVVARREATDLERQLWLAFFDHYLARKLLNNYMDDEGEKITLTRQEMEDCNPVIDLRESPDFMEEVSRLQQAGGGQRTFAFRGLGGARTNGTLGTFTIHYQGTLIVNHDGTWRFEGTMRFTDEYDFDPGSHDRPLTAELKVLVASTLLAGQGFDIDSVTVPVSQNSVQSRVEWGAPDPVHVPNRLIPGLETGLETDAGTGGEFLDKRKR